MIFSSLGIASCRGLPDEFGVSKTTAFILKWKIAWSADFDVLNIGDWKGLHLVDFSGTERRMCVEFLDGGLKEAIKVYVFCTRNTE